MFNHAKRGIAVAGLAAAMMGALAAPALAEPQIELELFVNDIVLAPGAAEGESVYPILMASDDIELTNTKLTVDFSELKGIATITSVGCDVDAAEFVVTCERDSQIVDPIAFTPSFEIKAVDGAKIDDAGVLKFRFTADGGDELTTSAEVIVGEGVDLVAGADRTELSVAPGAKFTVPVSVANVGEPAANGAGVVFYGDYAIEAGAERYSNCFYDGDSLRACFFEESLTSGKTYAPATPLELRLRADTAAPHENLLEVLWETSDQWGLWVKRTQALGASEWLGQPGDGEPLRLVERKNPKTGRSAQADVDPSNNWTGLVVKATGDNPYDLAAIGGSAAGARGAVVALDLGVKNVSNVVVDHSRSTEPVARVVVELPEGTSAVEVPAGCRAREEKGDFLCVPSWMMKPGEAETFGFKLRIDKVVNDAKGSVRLFRGYSQEEIGPDKNSANDSAAILINRSNGGELPVTGVQSGLIAVAGGAFVALGAAVIVLARRRQVTMAE